MKKMFRIIATILSVMMIISLAACGKDGGNHDNETTSISESTEEIKNTEKIKEEYTGVFQAGYGRVDITPTVPVYLNDGTLLHKVRDPLYVTAIAVHDGEQTVLIITADIKNLGESDYLKVAKLIMKATNVPEENIMISATHNHSAPTPGQSTVNKSNARWQAALNNNIVDACKAAVEDLSDAEIYVGSFKTTGMAFVRRYFNSKGEFRDIMTIKNEDVIVAHESEADDTAQLIRFVRKEKKDILLANWQCHVASMISVYQDSVSSDFVGYYRDIVEKGDDDLLTAYYQGASGNINATARVKGSTKYMSYLKKCEAFGELALEASSLDKMTRIQAGKITAEREKYTVKVMKDSEERIANAKETKAAGYPSDLVKKYGFSHWREVDAVLGRVGWGDTHDIYISAISFGELGFVSVPYEMYDTNGMQVKEGSPAKMTFILTCAGGSYAYVASTEASKNGGYDAYKTFFEYGTGDEVAGVLVDMLKRQFNK